MARLFSVLFSFKQKYSYLSQLKISDKLEDLEKSLPVTSCEEKAESSGITFFISLCSFLYVWMGKGKHMCCGSCVVTRANIYIQDFSRN